MNQLSGYNRINHMFDYTTAYIVITRIFVMLGRDNDRVHSLGLSVLVSDRDLALSIGANEGKGTILTSIRKLL